MRYFLPTCSIHVEFTEILHKVGSMGSQSLVNSAIRSLKTSEFRSNLRMHNIWYISAWCSGFTDLILCSMTVAFCMHVCHSKNIIILPLLCKKVPVHMPMAEYMFWITKYALCSWPVFFQMDRILCIRLLFIPYIQLCAKTQCARVTLGSRINFAVTPSSWTTWLKPFIAAHWWKFAISKLLPRRRVNCEDSSILFWCTTAIVGQISD